VSAARTVPSVTRPVPSHHSPVYGDVMTMLGPISLRDGSRVDVRPIAPADVCRLRAMFDRLSPTSIYYRFFAPIHRPRAGVLEHLAAVDHDRREALVAVVDDEIVAVARYEGAGSGTEAELAVTVEDAWQRRGLGALLSARLAHLARIRGYTAFTATVLGENRAALALMRAISPDARVRFASGQYGVYAPLPDVTASRSRTR
jgi:RimJ/RimL family protein N-acetyltransferase